ncbi:hypothetical protein IQ270_06515 [Microcoleus sp. LEGE 07076]|uniref:hypothetical protein n=1 Tax=Microcoleus sp. LEGE 07076 TaxID=915322 RepID=UPI00187F2E33|nr:hypothetical protein [Microcoleus sp. LEGE 07076]
MRDIPLYLRVGSGHESDGAVFAQLILELKQQWNVDALFLADAALYTAANLQQMTQLRWVSDLSPIGETPSKTTSKSRLCTQTITESTGKPVNQMPDAAAAALSQQLPYHQLQDKQAIEIREHKKSGRPRLDAAGQKHYQICAVLVPKGSVIAAVRQRAGLFLLATNVLD